ncbi:MAG TPA: protein translocase subunit SecD [Marinobacter sp.]|nr:protein translocase subunit SecD [Marinobacter sp.]
MLNKYPLWKNIVILITLVIGVIYALPNLYPDDYAIQITGARSSTEVNSTTLAQAVKVLESKGIKVTGSSLNDRDALIRLTSAEDQLQARPAVQSALGRDYLVALNMAPSTPGWLKSIGAGPMKLGLDLRGGVHFLLEVDMETAVNQRLEAFAGQIKRELRDERIRYRGGNIKGKHEIVLNFRDEDSRDQAFDLIRKKYNQFLINKQTDGDELQILLSLSDAEVRSIQQYALDQNLTTIRNRVNELGVAEPLVQRQGANRIIVELPGVQDTAQAKRVLGATANLEFRMEARQDAAASEVEEFGFRDNPQRTARLERDIISTGNNVANAQQGFDENGQPQVNITMDSIGGDQMNRATRNAIGRRMAVLFIEFRTEPQDRMVDGVMTTVDKRVVDKGIISLATVQSALGSSFRITGLDSIPEASELALLLRAGALAAPMYFVQERTIGPSLGQKNIDAGVMSVALGFALVLLYMLLYYRGFGLIANIALALNLILLVACMSMLSATLTLPGIAGIVLTVGMAVDANVLIFERIREELADGAPPQSAINAGYSRAFVAIFDANITTLLVAIILFAMGAGPVKGFAVTLCLGIMTSLFTGVVVSRGITNLVYGGRKVEKLSIGGKSQHVSA